MNLEITTDNNVVVRAKPAHAQDCVELKLVSPRTGVTVFTNLDKDQLSELVDYLAKQLIKLQS